jgi:putative ABC transport system permease protein
MATIDVSQRDRPTGDGRELYSDLMDRLRATPGVESAALGLITPFSGRRMANDVLWDPEARTAGATASALERTNVDMNVVDSSYFDTMQIPVVRGRAFRVTDGIGAPDVAVVNRAMADRLWPGDDPLGQQVWSWNRDGDHRPLEVVGVVGDGRYYRSWRLEGRPFLFVPFDQWPQRNMAIHVRSRTVTASDLRRLVDAIDASLPSIQPRRGTDAMAQSMAVEQMTARLLGAFGLLAMTIAAIGIYGVVSFLVGQRTYEIGLRVALGAPRRTILRVVLAGSVRLIATGIAIGWVAAIGLTQLISSVLFGVRPTDPVTFGGVSAILLFVGLAASYLPARRAMRVDPLITLRSP